MQVPDLVNYGHVAFNHVQISPTVLVSGSWTLGIVDDLSLFRMKKFRTTGCPTGSRCIRPMAASQSVGFGFATVGPPRSLTHTGLGTAIGDKVLTVPEGTAELDTTGVARIMLQGLYKKK